MYKEVDNKQTYVLSTNILLRYYSVPLFNRRFFYHPLIGRLNFLDKSNSSNISYATNQFDFFSKKPRALHRSAIKNLDKYLFYTMTDGIILDPNKMKSFEIFTDV